MKPQPTPPTAALPTVGELVTLDAWARARYGEEAPHPNTLRRWVREAKIVPVPKKNGRSYFVSRHAEYKDWSESNEPAETHVG